MGASDMSRDEMVKVQGLRVGWMEAENWKMGGRIQHIQLGGPMLIKEIVIASVLAFAAGGAFKMWHWDMQKRSKNFYHQLDRGEATVVAQDY
ncbi:hypothetical protein KY290_005247 [Solanum tuberosum]|uniref:Uncharacterized protein n=4 Tax=Solanum TaxID=4107 RepID=A0ABQ7WDZ4_SOLTU|nr:hypothetical protein KY289_005640 [Solanum tuberosum]KAH0778820.1 hypothetical protein KY290_005247 [Solanum tuberosum]